MVNKTAGCSVSSCPNKHRARGFCSNHYNRFVARANGYKRPKPSGYRKTRKGATYHSWYNMVNRCTNPKSQRYDYYGGRGITVDKRWLGEEGLNNFIEDMGLQPEGLTIDRIDNDKGYSKENCRWADWKTQANNKRNNR